MRTALNCFLTALAVSAAFVIVVSAQTAGDPTAGKAAFERRCSGCHALDRDKEGPRLAGVYGRAAAAASGFPYSSALKKSGIVWNDVTLDAWLTDTEGVAPQNDMAFRVENAGERRDIIAWLKLLSGK